MPSLPPRPHGSQRNSIADFQTHSVHGYMMTVEAHSISNDRHTRQTRTSAEVWPLCAPNRINAASNTSIYTSSVRREHGRREKHDAASPQQAAPSAPRLLDSPSHPFNTHRSAQRFNPIHF